MEASLFLMKNLLSNLLSLEVWLGEYEGKKVAIKIHDLKTKTTNHFITEAAIMT